MLWATLGAAWAVESGCDVARLVDAAKLPPAVAAESLAWGASALATHCRLPDGVGSALTELPTVAAEHRWQVDMKTASDEADLVEAACPAAPGVAVDVAYSKVRADARRLVYKQCELAQRGLFTEEEWVAAEGALINTVVLAHWLPEQKVAPEVARVLVRAVAGLATPLPTPPAP